MPTKILASEVSKIIEGLYCEDIATWQPIKGTNYAHEINNGLMNKDGVYSKLFLRIHHFYNPTTKLRSYTFSIFRKSIYGSERVYQLDICKPIKITKDKHNYPHEHYGDQRNLGDSNWINWSFNQAKDYFLLRTGITIEGEIDSPDEFELK